MRKVEYKLVMVESDIGDDGRTQRTTDLCIIGYFASEESLKSWAEQNKGCLDTENKD